MNAPSPCTIETIVHGRDLVDAPAPGARPPMLVGFHGYGENADRHLEQLRMIPGTEAWLIVAVLGLHRFYARSTGEVVASWMTRQDRELAIADNVAYVDRVLEAVRRDHPADARLVYAGFSQGVAMAYRAAARGAAACGGVIAVGGDIPPELRAAPAARFPRVLLARGARDDWYTQEKMDEDVRFLRSIDVRVECLVFDGGHEWTDEVRQAAGTFLASISA